MSKEILVLLAGRRCQDSAQDQPDESRNLVVLSVTIDVEDDSSDWTEMSFPANRKSHFERKFRWNTQNLK
jgi:hypothetical protein